MCTLVEVSTSSIQCGPLQLPQTEISDSVADIGFIFRHWHGRTWHSKGSLLLVGVAKYRVDEI